MSFMKILLWIILYPFLDAILVLNRPYFGLMTRSDDQVDDQVCYVHIHHIGKRYRESIVYFYTILMIFFKWDLNKVIMLRKKSKNFGENIQTFLHIFPRVVHCAAMLSVLRSSAARLVLVGGVNSEGGLRLWVAMWGAMMVWCSRQQSMRCLYQEGA